MSTSRPMNILNSSNFSTSQRSLKQQDNQHFNSSNRSLERNICNLQKKGSSLSTTLNFAFGNQVKRNDVPFNLGLKANQGRKFVMRQQQYLDFDAGGES